MYTRLEINSCKAKLLDLTIVFETVGHTENPIWCRKAGTINCISGTQGYAQYYFKTNRCVCRSASRIYNSKCRRSLLWENKNE